MTTRIPPLLEPYLALPPETSLIVLTSVLGASTNWLVLRYLHSFLNSKPGPSTPGEEPATNGNEVSVLLVSFLRDYAFWRDGAARVGVDLDAAGRKGRLVFVDGLTQLFASLPGSTVPPGWVVKLKSPRLDDVSSHLHAVADHMLSRESGRKVVLVVDQVDLLLASMGGMDGGEKDGVGMGLRLREMMLDIREKTYATVMTLSADEPLVAGQTTTLEKDQAALVLSAAHEAEMVLSLRLLDTGTAKDVSGVVRITRGGAESSQPVEEKEYLYYVGGDGGVRIVERGQ